jgi:hypothetical protein
MFDNIQECASNAMTKNINDLLEYYGKLKQQEAMRKPKPRCQDKNNSQPARTRINAAKETKTSTMETIAPMKSSFAPTISSADIQMLNLFTLTIQK